MVIQFDEDKQRLKLGELRKKEEEEYTELTAKNLSVPYIDLSTSPIDTDALRLIPETKAREAETVSFSLIDKKVRLAAKSPLSSAATAIKDELTGRGYVVTVYAASPAGINRAIEKYKELSFAFETKSGALDISNEEITKLIREVKSSEDIKQKIEEVLKNRKSYRVTRIVEIIIAGAMAIDASDIHVEPEENYARLRYRLDGVLHDMLTFDLETFGLILSRIKLLSGLKLNIKSEAQDGRFSVRINDTDIEIRTSMLPGAYNESIVLRILNPKSIALSMEELGFGPELLEILDREIRRPNGMILTTGPTGSGKTTTLYSFMRRVHKPEIKIITIEDPIEYHLPGIVQTQTEPDKGYTFELGLRSAVRQDPDIIMVGEIRDNETADIAINAALTGHLVFSTLHTNNAAGAFPRLIDLGVNPKIISSAVTIAMAQRLVRKLCVDCKKERAATDDEKRLVLKILGEMKKTPPSFNGKIWEAPGCAKCNFTGYRGRIGIFEAILMSQEIEQVVRENPSEREIREVAEKQGLQDMRQDGVIKVINGVTALDELKRVIDLEDPTESVVSSAEDGGQKAGKLSENATENKLMNK